MSRCSRRRGLVRFCRVDAECGDDQRLWSFRHTGKGLVSALTILYRPVGQRELDLIAAADYRAFPPRLSWQPIFYPVTNEGDAVQIARDWNTKDAENGSVGDVTRSSLPAEYLTRFPVQKVGGREHTGWWVPAEELDEFNRQIVGRIEVIREFRPA